MFGIKFTFPGVVNLDEWVAASRKASFVHLNGMQEGMELLADRF